MTRNVPAEEACDGIPEVIGVDVSGVSHGYVGPRKEWDGTWSLQWKARMFHQSGSLLYLADLKANTAILATEGTGRKEAVIYDLRDLVLLNGIALQNAEKLVPVRGQRKERIAGRVCTEHTAQWDNEVRLGSPTFMLRGHTLHPKPLRCLYSAFHAR